MNMTKTCQRKVKAKNGRVRLWQYTYTTFTLEQSIADS